MERGDAEDSCIVIASLDASTRLLGSRKNFVAPHSSK